MHSKGSTKTRTLYHQKEILSSLIVVCVRKRTPTNIDNRRNAELVIGSRFHTDTRQTDQRTIGTVIV